MTKTGKIRNFVRGNPGCTEDAVMEGTRLDRNFVKTILGQRVKRGEFVLDGDGYSANEDYAMRRSPGTGKKSLPKKLCGFRAARREQKKREKPARVKSMRDLAQKYAPVLSAATHVRTTLAVVEAVLDLADAEPMVQTAFAAHREAVAMLAGGAL